MSRVEVFESVSVKLLSFHSLFVVEVAERFCPSRYARTALPIPMSSTITPTVLSLAA
jgi:hypothetical protein